MPLVQIESDVFLFCRGPGAPAHFCVAWVRSNPCAVDGYSCPPS